MVEAEKRPDLYIGLVGASGTNLDPVLRQIRAQLAGFHYNCKEIKVSQLIGDFLKIETTGLPEDRRIEALMDGGDRLRKFMEKGDAVAYLIVREIDRIRSELAKGDDVLCGNTAFVVNSLKNPYEIELLESIYGRNFYSISVYSDERERQELLAAKIAASERIPVEKTHRDRALNIMQQDEKRSNDDLSQNVEDTFPKADFFAPSNTDVASQVERFFDLVFGAPFITPTRDEYGMYIAKSAALQSCDLSRQVGASIFEEGHSIVSVGCNEVPYPGSGIFYEDRPNAEDNRDHTIQYDPNFIEIERTLQEVLEALGSADILNSAAKSTDKAQLASELLHGGQKEYFLGPRIRNLLEFGRVVHAEMAAICDAARGGKSLQGTVMYCTTFPCHMCARHIISAGVSQVVFIEPYRKSLTKALYAKEITTPESKESLPDTVLFRPFLGVSPKFYLRAFNFRKAKDSSGMVAKFDRTKAVPRGAVMGVADREMELFCVEKVGEIDASLIS